MMMRALRRAGGEFALADRAVAVFVELAEHRVGETLVSAPKSFSSSALVTLPSPSVSSSPNTFC